MTILHTYVENQAILGFILLYSASKCKQTKEPGSEDCFWTHIFIFLLDYCQVFFFFLSRCKRNTMKLCYNRFQLKKQQQQQQQHKLALHQTQSGQPKNEHHMFFLYFTRSHRHKNVRTGIQIL